MTSQRRGSRPKKTDDGSCGRRIKKPTLLGGNLDPLDVCPVHTSGVLAEVARVSYQLRKRRVPLRAMRSLRCVRRLLTQLVPRLPPRSVVEFRELESSKSHPPPPPPPPPSRVRPGLGLHRRPVNFVSGGTLDFSGEIPWVPPKPRRPRPVGGVLRRRWPKNLTEDPRVAGTILESYTARDRRAKRNALALTTVVGPSYGIIRAKREPSPQAPISQFELSAALGTFKGEGFMEFGGSPEDNEDEEGDYPVAAYEPEDGDLAPVDMSGVDIDEYGAFDFEPTAAELDAIYAEITPSGQ